MMLRMLAIIGLSLMLFTGCPKGTSKSQISGMVTFKGKPVPAGYISLTPNVDLETFGQIRVLQIKDGIYDSSKEREPGIAPGHYSTQIAGFDGIALPLWQQGKQIFNPVKDSMEIPIGVSTKDWEIPESAGQNVIIQPTGDPVEGIGTNLPVKKK